jgi:ABC-type multidrug transport system permease subunit
VILRERSSGSYRLSAYFIAKSLNELPYFWEIPLLLIVLTYFTVGLKLTPGAFFIFLALNLISAWTAASMGLLISAFAGNNLNRGITIMTIATLLLFLNGGFFVSHYPSWIVWINYLSFIKFIIDAHVINEFSGTIWKVESVCGLPGKLSSINTTDVSGEIILQNYPLFINDIGLNVLVVFGFGVLFRMLALFSLQYTMSVPNSQKKKKKKPTKCCK